MKTLEKLFSLRFVRCMSSKSSCDKPPPNKKQKMSFEDNENENKNDFPKYQTMKDLNFPQGYKPIFSRSHLKEYLESDDLSKIEIILTKEEKETFNEIKCAISNNKIFPNQTIVRCAGGWVRDKLLNITNNQINDIDLTIDNMTGEQFGKNLQKHFKLTQNKDLNITNILENPEKSKHLASITFKLNNIEFDVVNLRKEIYNNNNRIPLMVFGTPKEDAKRRDLTINSLFYNINNDTIEDFTRNGMKDLINGIARTPLNAMITYKDDPLRILRNIRHTITKLGFIFDNDIIIAAQNKQIHKLLSTKVTEERFAIEFEKILRGYYVSSAINCLIKFDLVNILFKIPIDNNDLIVNIPNDFDVNEAWNTAGILTENITNIIINKYNKDNNEQKMDNNSIYDISICFGNNTFKHKKDIQKDILFAAFTYPFNKISVQKKEKKNRIETLVMYFVLNSIKGMPNGKNMANTVNIYHNGCNLFIELLQKLANETLSNDKLSLEIGKFLYLTKDNWIYVMYLIRSVCNIYYKNEIDIKIINELESWIITKSKLINCWKWKPLLNGIELLNKYKQYGLDRDARIGKLNQFILEHRLAKPSVKIEDLNEKIIKWLNENPKPIKVVKKKSKKKSNRNK